MASLLDRIKAKLKAEEEKYSIETGRGRHGSDKVDTRIGFSKGLIRALEIVNEEAKAEKEED